MTDATSSGTPLVISVLALGVSLAAVLVARANLQRQLQVAAREVWMREFREQVAQFLTSVMRGVRTEAGTAAPAEEIRCATLSFFVTKLLLAEKAPQYDDFERLMNRLLGATTGRAAGAPTPPEFNEVGNRAAGILRRERGLIEAMTSPGKHGWRTVWSRFVAWLCRDPPRFPTYHNAQTATESHLLFP